MDDAENMLTRNIFITGSADGLGQMAARLLIDAGHEVVLHGRHEARAQAALKAAPGAHGAVQGDLSSIAQTVALAEEVNRLGRFDAVIHNAAVGYREPRRLIYLSSGLHRQCDRTLQDLTGEKRLWQGTQAYSDSKLHDALLAFAVARRWPQVLSNALEPGWVATKMGGPEAPDDLEAAPATQVWLAVSNEPAATVSGDYFYHLQRREPHPVVYDASVQERLLEACKRLSGIRLPD
jgi:NAD(P)-dependent dehydrogenase (short-subunit alcohol dehydrogenase family)